MPVGSEHSCTVVYINRKRYASQTFVTPPTVTLIAKMLSSIKITLDGAVTKPEETRPPQIR